MKTLGFFFFERREFLSFLHCVTSCKLCQKVRHPRLVSHRPVLSRGGIHPHAGDEMKRIALINLVCFAIFSWVVICPTDFAF
ncbi:MAG: hypothetical protein U0V70_00025, partial [Terriglobia bacterium]